MRGPMINRNILLRSFIFSFLYVGLGVVSLLGMYPSSPIYWEWSYIGFAITLPVSVFSFGILYTEGNNYDSILLIQSVVFLVFWLLLYLILLSRLKRLNPN